MRSRTTDLLGFVIVFAALAGCTGVSASSTKAVEGGAITAPTGAVLDPAEHLGPNQESPLAFEEGPCPMDLPVGAVEGENILCGTVMVPERHAQPEGVMIRLAVAVVKSESEQATPDPLVMLSGGPGQSALTSFTPLLFSPLGAGLHTDRDVVIVEQRGTRYSTPFLFCDENYGLNFQLMAQNLNAEARKPFLEQALSSCYQRLAAEGVDLSAYNSLENAADVVAVLRALGYESFNIYGGSYGTMLAQHIMREYPDGVRSVILDSVAPLRHEPNLLYKAHSADRALRMLFAACAGDPACATAYPDLEEVFFQTVASLNQSPTEFQVTNPNTGEAYPLLLTGDKLVQIVRDYMYATPLLPLLPRLITDVAESDYALLSRIQGLIIFRQDIADGMYKSVVCSELVDFTAQDFADAAGLYPPVTRVMQDLLGEIWIYTCEVWQVDPLEQGVKTSVASDIPTLLIEGEFDPTVPPPLAEVASEGLSQAYSYTFPSVGHGVFGSVECAAVVMRSFLDDPSGAPDTSCIESMQGLVFEVPVGQVEVTFVPFTSTEFGIEGIVPEGWIDVGAATYARGSSVLDRAALLQQVLPMELQEALAAVAKNYGLLKAPDQVGELVVNDLNWNLYRLEVQGVNRDVALAERGGQTLIVILASDPSERDMLCQTVLLPVVEALVPQD